MKQWGETSWLSSEIQNPDTTAPHTMITTVQTLTPKGSTNSEWQNPYPRNYGFSFIQLE